MAGHPTSMTDIFMIVNAPMDVPIDTGDIEVKLEELASASDDMTPVDAKPIRIESEREIKQ